MFEISGALSDVINSPSMVLKVAETTQTMTTMIVKVVEKKVIVIIAFNEE